MTNLELYRFSKNYLNSENVLTPWFALWDRVKENQTTREADMENYEI